ncbi:MAG: hypothetical protein PHQ12_08485, partial [Chthoniobacteraceae bacterium]|nr:hypothetical protein [Chthoniobacteraceae bacterium]
MSNRHQICAALLVFSSLSLAQEAPAPATDASAAASDRTAAPSAQIPTPSLSGSAAASGEEAEGFSLPGGMGYTPLNFTPGQGTFDRAPLNFSTTASLGYDDNVYSTKDNEHGSMITSLTEGVDLLLSQDRFALSLGANAGGQYYWDRSGDQLTPTGGLNLVTAYKLSPRAQLSGVVNATYTNQPTVSTINGAVQSRGQEYFIINSKFDLLYSWLPRVSTDTTYSINGIYYKNSAVDQNDSTTQTIGQSVRYQFSRLITGVLEGRYSQVQYNSNISDTNLY